MLTAFPFGALCTQRLLPPLGPTHPCPSVVDTEPFSTSALKVSTRVVATATKICTSGRSTRARARASPRPPRLSTRWPRLRARRASGRALVTRWSAIHFQGCCIRQVSCYTLLSGFRLPWPSTCCLNAATPFVVSLKRVVRHLSAPFGSSRIASSAYQNRPTWALRLARPARLGSGAVRARSQFDDERRASAPPGLLIIRFTRHSSPWRAQLS